MKNLIYCIKRARYLHNAELGGELRNREMSLSDFQRSILNGCMRVMIKYLMFKISFTKFRREYKEEIQFFLIIISVLILALCIAK